MGCLGLCGIMVEVGGRRRSRSKDIDIDLDRYVFRVEDRGDDLVGLRIR